MPEQGRPVQVTRQGDHHVLRLAGGVNLDVAAELHEQASRLAVVARHVSIDWSEAGPIHACGLQILLALRAALLESGAVLDVTGDQPRIRQHLELAGFGGHFPPGKVALDIGTE